MTIFMTVFRLFRFFWPFVADVFRHSAEERRVMIARVIAIALVVIAVAWFYVNDKLDDLDQARAVNARLSSELVRLQGDNNALHARLNDKKDVIETCKAQTTKLEEEKQRLEKEVGDFQHRLMLARTQENQGEHTLTPKETSVEPTKTPLTSEPIPNRDRLKELR